LAKRRTTIPSQPNDARANKSVEALREAFLRLIERKTFDDISNKEIADAAGVSYPTFFRRFAGKKELLEEVAIGEIRKMFSIGGFISEGQDPKDAFTEICEYIDSRRKLWTVLLNGVAAMTMRQEFIRLSQEVIESGRRINPWIPADLAQRFVVGGIFEILSWWMNQPEDYSLNKVVALCDALIFDVAARRRNIVID
jgi:AcrR family transcriptional regulator